MWPAVGGAPVPAQMWQGRAQSCGRCGRGEPSAGANVVGASPVPGQMWLGRGRTIAARSGEAALESHGEASNATTGGGDMRCKQTFECHMVTMRSAHVAEVRRSGAVPLWEGWAQCPCRCGLVGSSPVPAQMWAGGAQCPVAVRPSRTDKWVAASRVWTSSPRMFVSSPRILGPLSMDGTALSSAAQQCGAPRSSHVVCSETGQALSIPWFLRS